MGGREDAVDYMPANIHESFLQVDNISFGQCSYACPKYPKQVYSIFVISQENRER